MPFFTEMGKTYRVTGSDIDAWLDYTPPGGDVHDPGQSNNSAGFSLAGSPGCLITVVEQCQRIEDGYVKGSSQYASYEVVKVTVKGHDGNYYAWVVYEGVVKVEEYTLPAQPPGPEPEPEPETEPQPEPGPQPGPEPQSPEPPGSQPGDVQIEVHAGQTVVVEVKATTAIVLVDPGTSGVIGLPPLDDWLLSPYNEATTYGGHGHNWGLPYDIPRPLGSEIKPLYPGIVQSVHQNPLNYELWNNLGVGANTKICILRFADVPVSHILESEEECRDLAENMGAAFMGYTSYIEQESFNGYGNYIEIANSTPLGGVSAYCHVAGVTVRKGMKVQTDTPIAQCGGGAPHQPSDRSRSMLATRGWKEETKTYVYHSPFGPCGSSTGSHLHYEGRYDRVVKLFTIRYEQWAKMFPDKAEAPEWTHLAAVGTSIGWIALQRLFGALGFALGSSLEQLGKLGDGVQSERWYFKDKAGDGVEFHYCLEVTDGEWRMEGPAIPWRLWRVLSCYAKGLYRFK